MPVKMSNSLWNIENKKIKLWRFVNVNVNVNVKFSMKHRDEKKYEDL